MLDMILIFLNLQKFVLQPNIESTLENVPWELEKDLYSAALGQNML